MHLRQRLHARLIVIIVPAAAAAAAAAVAVAVAVAVESHRSPSCPGRPPKGSAREGEKSKSRGGGVVSTSQMIEVVFDLQFEREDRKEA